MNYKDKRLTGTVEYIRDNCEDSKDFEPIIEKEAGVYNLFLIKMEKLDPKAHAYADVRAKIKQLFIESIEEVNCGHN